MSKEVSNIVRMEFLRRRNFLLKTYHIILITCNYLFVVRTRLIVDVQNDYYKAIETCVADACGGTTIDGCSMLKLVLNLSGRN